MTKPLTRILYVEDEPDIRMVAQMALQAVGGFTVIACASGQEALDAAPGAGPTCCCWTS
jgi:two-component system OmpR family response regulator